MPQEGPQQVGLPLARRASGVVDGRSRQPFAAVPWAEPIAVWMAEQEASRKKTRQR